MLELLRLCSRSRPIIRYYYFGNLWITLGLSVDHFQLSMNNFGYQLITSVIHGSHRLSVDPFW